MSRKKRMTEEQMKEAVSRYLGYKELQYLEHLEAYAEAYIQKLRLDVADYIQRLYKGQE